MAIKIDGKTTKVLREERYKLAQDAKAFLEANEGSWDDQKDGQYGAMISDVSDYAAAIKRREASDNILSESRFESRDNPLESPNRAAANQEVDYIELRDCSAKAGYSKVKAGRRGSKAYRAAFNNFLQVGANGLGPEFRAALQSDDATQAGYLVASEQFASELLRNVDDLVFIRRYANIITVPEADTLGIRRISAKLNTFNWSSELAVSTEDSTLAFGKKVLTPHPLTGAIKVSRDLIRRAVIGADQIVRSEMARNAGEKMEDGYLTGNGAQQPLGVFTASTDGISTSRDVNTGSTTSITADGLIDAKYALKSQYRSGMMGPVRWLFHRDAVKIVSKLKDSQNQYLWQPGLQMGQPDMLLNFPVDESERVPNTFTSNNYVGLLANWNYYYIADALDLEVQVLDQLYAATNQIGYIGRIKTDGMPVVEEAFVRLKCAT